MKRSLVLAVAIAVTWSCWYGLRSGILHPAQAQVNSTTSKQRSRIQGGQITVFDCRVTLIDRAVLASERPGILEFVEPDEGDQVRLASEVARLHDGVARAALAVAERKATNNINVRFAKKALELANKELEIRVETNRQVPGTIPQIEVEQYKLASAKSMLQIEQAEEEFTINGLGANEAVEQLKTFSIRAPFDGVVTSVYKRKGEAVRQGDPILEVVSTNRVRVEAYVDIKNAWSVQAGDLVEVQLEIPNVDLPVEREKFAGRIVFVDVVVQAVTRTVRVYAEVANHQGKLKTGLAAKMTISTRQVAQNRNN